MAIQFARCQYVSRSSGGNACRKASYNQRETISCERTGQVFSFKERGGNLHHEILLPEGANEKYKNSEALWNEAERCERRKDSQVAKEFVIALPDNKQITLEDRIELTRRFAQTYFVDKGVGVRLDLHEPHEKDGLDDTGAANWHAHLLVTTRRFSEDGLGLSNKKARDLDPTLKKGFVVEADIWGEYWRDLQNAYFEEKGYDIQVDPIGVIAQEPLGPVRMRHHMNEAIQRSRLLEKANEKLAKDPETVIEALTQTRAIFTERDVEAFLRKHVPAPEREKLFGAITNHPKVLGLYEKDTGTDSGYFTTEEVRREEEKLLRFADGIAGRHGSPLKASSVAFGKEGKSLSSEQNDAYTHCTSSGENLCIVQGRAGVGKSYVIDAIRKAHEDSKYRVLGLAPTHKVSTDMKESGIKEAKTCHSFLFAFKNNRECLDKNTLVIVDEAGMLGTELSVELFHTIRKTSAKLVLVGDDRQLSSVNRGGAFSLLAEKYSAIELKDVRRQSIDWQKAASEHLSQGEVRSAVHLLDDNKAISWQSSKEEALSGLLKTWSTDRSKNPEGTRQILAHRNVDVDALNQGAREILREQGKLGDIEISCMTQRGICSFAVGDRVQLTKTDKEQGLHNGSFGKIESIDPQTQKITLLLDNKEKKEINPHSYDGLKHGYASTVYKAQGSTLDHVYVLHSSITNHSISYVSLTRQTQSLSLHVTKEETSNINQLIRQMSREGGKGTSLVFDTKQDIEKRLEEKTLASSLKDKVDHVTTKVRDTFHKNDKFYQYEKPKELAPESPLLSSSVFDIHGKSFDEVKKMCERRLFQLLIETNKAFTSERIERASRQAERTAIILFKNELDKKENPSLAEVKAISLRAKYELDRLPEIRKEMMKELDDTGGDELRRGFLAQMIAERRASIEGRFMFEAKQQGKKIPSTIEKLAEKEFKSHQLLTKDLAKEIGQKYTLSKEASLSCAKNMLRYKEMHGEKPSESQIQKMVTIEKTLEENKAIKTSHKLNPSVQNYLNRKVADYLFYETKPNSPNDIADKMQFAQKQAVQFVQNIKVQIREDLSKQNQHELSI